MESSTLPFLLEEVLSGRSEDPFEHLQQTQKLHQILKSSSPSAIKEASVVVSELARTGKLSSSDFSLVSSYLTKIRQARCPPDLRHLPIVNSGLQVSTLCHVLYKIQLKNENLKCRAFLEMLLFSRMKQNHLEIKRLQCTRMIANIRCNLGLSLQKTMTAWGLKDHSEGPKNEEITRPDKRRTSLTPHQKKQRSLRSVKVLLMKIPMAFEQQAFWRWKIIFQEYKHYVENLKKGSEISNKIIVCRLLEAAFLKLKPSTQPLWMRRKHLLWKVLRKTELRLFFTKKIKMEFLKNFDVYEEYEEEEEEEHRRKIVKIVKRRPEAIKEKIKSHRPLLARAMRKATIRWFFALKLAVAKWGYLNKSIEETESKKGSKMMVSKKKTLRSAKAPAGPTVRTKEPNIRDLTELITQITRKSLQLNEPQEKIPILLQSTNFLDQDKSKLEKIVEILQKISLARKNFPKLTLRKWLLSRIASETKSHKYFKGILKLKLLLRSHLTRIISTLPKESITIHKEKVVEETYEVRAQVINPEVLKSLAAKAVLFANSPKIVLLRWRNRYLQGEINKIPTDALQSSTDNYTRALLSSVFKFNKSRLLESFRIWSVKHQSKRQEISKIKVEKLMETLNQSLINNSKYCLQMPKIQKTSDEILSNAVVALCKNLLWAKTKVFNNWTRFTSTKDIKGKVEEYLLRNLAKYPKMIMAQYYSRWRESKKNHSRQLFGMVSVLHRILASKAKRCFNPPRIIKDADQIMRRTIRKLTYVKDWALRLGLLRWKFFKLIDKSNSARKSVVKVMLMLSNPTKGPFHKWIQTTKALRHVHRSNGVSRIVLALSKVIRARYKMLVLKSLLSKKKITLFKTIWRQSAQKYCENLRISLLTWKHMIGSEDMVRIQTHKNSGVITIMHGFNKRLHESFKNWRLFKEKSTRHEILDNYRSLKLLMHFSEILKPRLQVLMRALKPEKKSMEIIKSLVNSYENKQKDAYNRWKIFNNSCKAKKTLDNYKASRLRDILRQIPLENVRAAHIKILGHGSRVKGCLKLIVERLKFKPRHAFKQWMGFNIRVKSKRKYTMGRNVQVKKVLNSLLHRLLLDAKTRIIGGGDKVKGVIKNMVTAIRKKTKITFTKWTTYVRAVKNKQIMDNHNTTKLKSCLRDAVRRTMKDGYTRIVGSGNKVRGVVKSILASIKKRPRNALKKWAKFAEDCDRKVLMDSVRSQKMNGTLNRIPRRTIKNALQRIIGDSKIYRLLSKLVKNYQIMQQDVIKRLWHRCEKIRTIRKINSAYVVFKRLSGSAQKVKASRFTYWKNLEYLRRRRIMKKALAKMMSVVAIGYEVSFWKWKYIISRTGFQLSPNHSIAFKRLFVAGKNLQKRNEQFAFYKLSLYHMRLVFGGKLSFPTVIAHIIRHSRQSSKN